MFKFSAFSFSAALTRFGLVVLLLACCRPAAAQAPAWQTAQVVATATMAGPSNFSQVRATAVDSAGNIYLAGSFSGSIALGTITLTSLTSNSDIFLAKFSPTANQFVWAQRAGGPNGETANALSVSGNSVYVAGTFTGPTANFGSVTLTQASPNSGSVDMFVAKLTDTGNTSNFVWAQQAGGTGTEVATALAVNGTSVYVTGTFDGSTANFGSTTLTTPNLGSGSSDIFVTRLNDLGNTGSFAWAQQAGGSLNDTPKALAVIGTNIYVAGDFVSSTIRFGPDTLTNGVGFAGIENAFVAKLADTGTSANFGWGRKVGGTSRSITSALAVSGANLYLAGTFQSLTATFDSTILTNPNPSGSSEIFTAKLADAGNTGTFVWAQRAGGRGDDLATALAVSGNNVYVAGFFYSLPASFGSISLSTSGDFDLFVCKLNDAGGTSSFVWAQRAGGTSSDFANALTISRTSVYVMGSSQSPTAVFGSVTLTNSSPSGSFNFLASLTDFTLAAASAAPPREPAALFPNPAQATTTLRRPAGAGAAALTLADALGRTVRRYPAPAGPTDTALDLKGLPAGLYLLRGAGPALRLAVE